MNSISNSTATVGKVWLETINQVEYYLTCALTATAVPVAMAELAAGKTIHQVLAKTHCAGAFPIGVITTVFGNPTALRTTSQASGEYSSCHTVPQLDSIQRILSNDSAPCYLQAGALGITTTADSYVQVVPGYQLLFVGSITPQPDTLLSTHLLQATKALWPELTKQGKRNEVLAYLSDSIDPTLKINFDPQWQKDNAIGLVWLGSPAAVALIKDHYLTTWELNRVSQAQVKLIGTVQAVTATPVTPSLSNAAISVFRAQHREPKWNEVRELEQVIAQVLAHPEITASPYRHNTDATAQGQTVIEPGLAGATVVAPLVEYGSPAGLAIKGSEYTRYGAISPYWQAINTGLDSLRHVVAVGATPLAMQLTIPTAEFTEARRGINDLTLALPTVPIIQRAITTTLGQFNALAIYSIGKLVDSATAVTLDFIQPGNLICLIGERKNELGGSVLYEIYHEVGANVPQPSINQVGRELSLMIILITQGLVPTCHVIGKGGLLATLAPMCFGGNGTLRTGITIDVQSIPGGGLTTTQKLFTETGGFIIEVDPRLLSSVVRHAKSYGLIVYPIGQIRSDELMVLTQHKTAFFSLPIGKLAQYWQTT